MTPSDVFERFAKDMATDPLVPAQLAAWSEARRKWRADWNQRAAASTMAVFESAFPGLSSSARDHAPHPVAAQAPELDSWRSAWQKAPTAEQNELAELFVRAVLSLETNAEALDEACSMLGTTTLGRAVPLAALSTAASSLDPSRYVVLCDAWLPVFHKDAEPATTALSYSQLNASALRWLAAADGNVLPPVLADAPASDRMAVVCTWAARTSRDANAGAKFDVTRKKYKDWPPMW